MKKTVKGWKCFDADLRCRGFQFKIGETYKIDGEIELCERGFHFHENPEHIFNYYGRDSRVCEVTAHETITGDDKSVCRVIEIGRELIGFQKYLIANGDGEGYGYGYGYGDGEGYGNGYGDGEGYGNGYGYGDGYGDGNGYGNGYGEGEGDGYGYGYGDGYGEGNGYGDSFIFSRSFKKIAA